MSQVCVDGACIQVDGGLLLLHLQLGQLGAALGAAGFGRHHGAAIVAYDPGCLCRGIWLVVHPGLEGRQRKALALGDLIQLGEIGVDVVQLGLFA
jgi:hypothetical protein